MDTDTPAWHTTFRHPHRSPLWPNTAADRPLLQWTQTHQRGTQPSATTTMHKCGQFLLLTGRSSNGHRHTSVAHNLPPPPQISTVAQHGCRPTAPPMDTDTPAWHTTFCHHHDTQMWAIPAADGPLLQWTQTHQRGTQPSATPTDLHCGPTRLPTDRSSNGHRHTSVAHNLLPPPRHTNVG